MSIINAATNAIPAVTNVVSGSPASALNAATDAVSGVTSALSSAASMLSMAPPLPNPLSSYATYDYILGLSVLKEKESNDPDSTYMKGRFSMPYICKSANTQPNSRVNTRYGKFDFFIENLTLNAVIGFQDYKNSTATLLTFDVVEPYSALMFPLALQTAAAQAGHGNWRQAPFLLTIEFRGNKEDGTMQNIPNINRYIPIKLTTMQIKTNERGTTYSVSAVVHNDTGKLDEFKKVNTDIAIKGKTIQEILQTGEQSLQAVVNKRLRNLKIEKKIVEDPDEIIILFPEKIESSFAPSTTSGKPETKGSATTTPTSTPQDSSEIEKKLGVSMGANKTFVQPDTQCNAIGKAKSGANTSRKGNTPVSKPTEEAYKSGTIDQSQVTADPSESIYNFAQSQDILTIINEVILSSDYVTGCLDKSKIDSRGMRGWWTIDTQVYYKSVTANLKKTGSVSRIIVYRVYPYQAHASAIPSPNIKLIGLDQISKTVVKKYDYIYTGKNTEVLKFDIDYSLSFSNILAADAGMSGMDYKRAKETSQQNTDTPVKTSGMAPGAAPKSGQQPTMISYQEHAFSTETKGGSLGDTPIHRAARAFHDALTKSVDMMILNMEIIGDPFWIPTSGMGNYTAPQGSRPGVTKDGSVDYQRTEVDVYVNFRTPLDINQNTGMYDFGASALSGPIIGFSGLYKVNQCVSTFRGGRFTQVLKGTRRPSLENTTTGTADQAINSSQTDVSKETEKLDYEGERKAVIDT